MKLNYGTLERYSSILDNTSIVCQIYLSLVKLNFWTYEYVQVYGRFGMVHKFKSQHWL